MRKINVFSILLLVSFGLFLACTEDENALGPSIDLIGTGGNYIIADVTVEPGAELPFKWTANKGDAKLDLFNIYRDETVIANWNDVEIPTAQNDSYTAEATLNAPNNEGVYVYTFEVTDKNAKTAEVSVEVTVEIATTPLSAAQTLEWVRVGGVAGTGLSTFGLKWTSNLKAVYAVIAKDAASKFVEFPSGEWTSIITKEDLAAAVDGGTDMADWRKVSAEADAATLDYVIGTKNGDNYYLIHITSSDVSTGTSGTTITINGQYKN